MSEENGPRYLNLDDLETESDITIKHDGKEHRMATLTVDKFIEQQKRASELEAESERAKAEGKEVDDDDMAKVVTLLKTSVSEYFPTIPVNELPVAKLFAIFGFLNEVSAKINDDASQGAEGVESTDGEASGNVEREDD